MIKIEKLVAFVCLGLTLNFEGTCSHEMCKKPKGFVGDTAKCTKVNQKAEWVRIISPETSFKQENINNNNCYYNTAPTTQEYTDCQGNKTKEAEVSNIFHNFINYLIDHSQPL
eukprot:GFUD01128572.1.p1 GENE.GFUD01128572.1~~GFUD01128572.1.p1  ORF type:complete len:113 (+),score=11.56 GFUD01128572.1:94-432(+)